MTRATDAGISALSGPHGSAVRRIPMLSSENTPSMSTRQSREATKWQERLLPFIIRMIVGLAAFFFIASLVQLIVLHWTMLQTPQLDLVSVVGSDVNPSKEIDDNALSVAKLRLSAILEAHIVQQRYHQAAVVLMSRTWLDYLGIMTGMILALVGAIFILAKLEEGTSELSAKSQAVELVFRSASPGLVLAALGVLLMITTFIVHHEINIEESSLYMGNARNASQPSSGDSSKPQTELPSFQ